MMYAQWYLLLLELKRWHRYAITVLSIAVVLLLWLLVFYFPLYKQTMMIDMQLHQRKQDLQTNVSEQQLCKKLSQEVDQLQAMVNTDSIELKMAMQQNIALIIAQLESNGLHLSSIKKEAIQQNEKGKSIPISIQAKGSLQSVYTFFDTLQKNQCLVQCSDLTIQHERDALYSLQSILKFFIPKKVV